tara:strand:- start:30481 stop:31419 length:939 start_codon:yes stop_codon:yes gene_type:complete
MKKMATILLCLLVLFMVARVVLKTPIGKQKVVDFTPSKKECGSVPEFAGLRYCVHLPLSGAPNGDIAYVLHGKDQNELMWNYEYLYGALVQKYWEQNRIVPPTVVSISFGPVWLLSPKGTLPDSGLMDLFVDRVIPMIESKIGKPQNRLVFGASMGGMNSLSLGLLHGNLFKRVGAVCPVMYMETPYSNLSEMKTFLQSTGAEPYNIMIAIALSRRYFSNKDEWDQFAPLSLINRENIQYNTKFYLSGALYDEWGVFRAEETFVEKAQAKGVSVEWHPQFGPHCVVDVGTLAEFLVADHRIVRELKKITAQK